MSIIIIFILKNLGSGGPVELLRPRKKIFSFASEVFEKRGAGGRIFFLFSNFFFIEFHVKIEFDGDMLFV